MSTSLADQVVFRGMALAPESALGQAVHFFVEDTAKIFFLLIVIVFVIGFFRSLVTPEQARKMIGGRSSWRAYVLAVVFGAVTPFCSCSSVPLFIGFLEAGIPLGVTMAFLIPSPMVNEVAVVILISAMGWKIATAYVVTGMVVGLVGGFAFSPRRLEGLVEDDVWKIRMGETATLAVDLSLKGRLPWPKANRKPKPCTSSPWFRKNWNAGSNGSWPCLWMAWISPPSRRNWTASGAWIEPSARTDATACC